MEDARKAMNTVFKVLGGASLGTLCGGFAGGIFGIVLTWVAEATDPAMAGIHTIVFMVLTGTATLACVPGALAAAVGMIWRPRFLSLLAVVFAALLTLYLSVGIPFDDGPESWSFSVLFFYGSPFVGALSGWAAVATMQITEVSPG